MEAKTKAKIQMWTEEEKRALEKKKAELRKEFAPVVFAGLLASPHTQIYFTDPLLTKPHFEIGKRDALDVALEETDRLIARLEREK